MTLECINPEDLPTPSTYTDVFVAGQGPEDERGKLVGAGDLVAKRRSRPRCAVVD